MRGRVPALFLMLALFPGGAPLAVAESLDVAGTRILELTIHGPAAREAEHASVSLSGRLVALPSGAAGVPGQTITLLGNDRAGLPGQTVTLLRDDVAVATTTTGIDGSWSIDAPVVDDVHRFRASFDLASITSTEHYVYVPSPFEIETTPDPARAATAAIDEDGGSLSVTAADGTVFTLTVPQGALLGEQAITMTPLASLTGFPFSMPVHGVQLEPDGLIFIAPAELEVAPPPDEDHTLTLAYGWTGGGDDPHMVPTELTEAIRIPIHHFSGYGVSAAFASDYAAARAARARHARDFLNEQLAQQLAQERQRQLLGNDESPLWDLIGPFLGTIYQQYVRPLLVLAGEDDRYLQEAIVAYVSWERSFQLIGATDQYAVERAEMPGLLTAAIEFGFDRAHARCVQDHDLSGLTTMLAVLDLPNALGLHASFDEAKIHACARFQLDFETIATLTFGEGSSTTSHVRALSVPLEVSTSVGGCSISESCEGPIEYRSFEVSLDDECGSWTEVYGPMLVEALYVNANLSRPDTPPSPPEITLAMGHFGGAGETVRFCPEDSPPYEIGFANYITAMLIAHGSDGGPIADWGYLGGSVWARKTFARTIPFGGISITEATTFDLRHTPQS